MELVRYRVLSPILGGAGGFAYSLLRSNRPATLGGFALTCALEALFIALPYGLGDRVAILAILAWPMGALWMFWGQILGWTIICSIVVFPASFVAGYQFPLLIALLGKGGREVGRQVGLAYAWNTAGAIAGALMGGFGLLPLLTTTGVWRATALGFVGLGLAALATSRGRSPRAWLAPVAAAAAVVLLCDAVGPTAVWRHTAIGAGRAAVPRQTPNGLKDWINSQRHKIVWEAEGVESSVALAALGPGLAFVINGKVDGNSVGDAPTIIMSGILGALLRPDPKRALVVGLGAGGTAGWFGAVPSIERVDVVELEPTILEVARDCFPVNRDVMRNPKVRITVGDGREALLVSRERYDLIFSEPSNPFRAGIASLFTKEYYEAALDRLSDDGLFLQWVQAYEIDPRTVRTIYATLSSVFPSVSAWQVSSGASSARRLPTSGPVRRRWRPSETHGGARIGGDTRATLDA